MKHLVILLLGLIIVSCDTEESNDIQEQSRIYAKYYAYAEEGSKKITGKVTFYEYASSWIHDYVALRGGSNVMFLGIPMIEVRDFSNRTYYENNFITTESSVHRELIRFSYINNDNNTYANSVNLPNKVVMEDQSVSVDYNQDKIVLDFDFRVVLDQEGSLTKCKNQKCANFKQNFFVRLYTTQSGQYDVSVNYNQKQLLLEKDRGFIKSIKICSRLEGKAHGASNRDFITVDFCDSDYIL